MIWKPGQQIQNGTYIVQDELGRGGFGITYKALHIHLDEVRVIKTPIPYREHSPDYAKYVDKFIREGRRLVKLTYNPHPHIVKAWELFKEGEIPCLVMDFVPGETLAQWVERQGALPEIEILPCIQQIGGALSFIHKDGLVHRDVNPRNIIVRTNDRKAILIDFGIAKDIIPSPQSTRGIAWSPDFAPYEQQGGSREPTVDVYSLAATLYFALTGERPATSLDRKLHSTALIAPQRVNPRISDRLNQAILKGMALEAGARPQSMQAWLQIIMPPERLPKATPPIAAPNPSPAPHVIIYPPDKLPKVIPPIATNFSPTPSSTPHKTNLPSAKRRRVRRRKIPWGYLASIVLFYTISGGLMEFVSAPLWLWAVAGALALALALAVALAVAWAVAEAEAVGMAGAVAVAWAVAWAVAVAGAVAWAVAVAGAVAGAVAVAVAVAGAVAVFIAGGKLLESFNGWQTFLILSGTSMAGLGLGWAIGFAIRSNGFHTVGML